MTGSNTPSAQGPPNFLPEGRQKDDFLATIIIITLLRTKVVNMTTSIGPKCAHKQLILIFTKDFEVSREP